MGVVVGPIKGTSFEALRFEGVSDGLPLAEMARDDDGAFAFCPRFAQGF